MKFVQSLKALTPAGKLKKYLQEHPPQVLHVGEPVKMGPPDIIVSLHMSKGSKVLTGAQLYKIKKQVADAVATVKVKVEK